MHDISPSRAQGRRGLNGTICAHPHLKFINGRFREITFRLPTVYETLNFQPFVPNAAWGVILIQIRSWTVPWTCDKFRKFRSKCIENAPLSGPQQNQQTQRNHTTARTARCQADEFWVDLLLWFIAIVRIFTISRPSAILGPWLRDNSRDSDTRMQPRGLTSSDQIQTILSVP